MRSSYLNVANPEFAIGGTTLRLEEVRDLASAPTVVSLRDAEDAFSLVFSGPGVGTLPSGTQRVRHSELGTFDIYLGPIGRDQDERIEVVVNRVLSNRESRRTPPRPAPARSAEQRAPDPKQAAQLDPGKVSDATIRRVRTKRTKRGLKVVVDFASNDVDELTAWLRRGDRIVAAGTHRVNGDRLAFTVKTKRRLRKGTYQLDLMATDAEGEQKHARRKLKLR